jgi:hypothetical protein
MTVLLLAVTTAESDPPPILIVGAYSNIVVTGTEAVGTRVELWQQGDLYFGLLQKAAGVAGEYPTGVLEGVRYDPATKTLIFRAKLSVGQATTNGETWVPTRDLYQFEGTLFPDQLSGTLLHADTLQPDRPMASDPVKLYRSKEDEASMPRPMSYEEWTAYARKLLETHGPRW